MPNRILRDGIISSHRMNALTPGAQLLFYRLMSVADDYGRYYGSAATVRGACWPTAPEAVTEREVEGWLRELEAGEEPLIVRYATVPQRKCPDFLEIREFRQQTRSKSKFPQYDINLLATCEQNASTTRARTSPSPNNDRRQTSTDSARNSRTNDGGVAVAIRVADGEAFRRWLEEWPRVADSDAAARAWISVVDSATEQLAFAVRDRYLASDEVARGVIMAPDRFLFQQAKCGWTGKWPPAQNKPPVSEKTLQTIEFKKMVEGMRNGK